GTAGKPAPTESSECKNTTVSDQTLVMNESSPTNMAENIKPFTNRHRRQSRNSRTIGTTIWNLNNPTPARAPAVKSRFRSSETSAAASKANNKIESCPCMSAKATG